MAMPAFLPAPPVIEDEIASIVAAPDRIIAWATIARPGDRFVYARREHLPPGSLGAATVRTLAARGIVGPRQKRSDLIVGAWVWYMVRLDKPWAPETGLRPTLAAAVGDVAEDLAQVAVDRLYPVLRRAAQYGRPCPTNRQIADRCEIALPDVPAVIDAAIALNLIRVEGCSAPTLRRVAIVDGGARTGYVS